MNKASKDQRDIATLTATCNKLKAENERLRGEIKNATNIIAGLHWPNDNEEEPSDFCPICLNYACYGHSENCELNNFLERNR